MGIKELIEKRAALLAEAQKPETTAERFAEIRSEVERLNFTIEQMQKHAADEQREEELRAARKPSGKPADGTVFDQQTETRNKETAEKIEKRAAALKGGKKVTVELRAAVTSANTALSTLAGNTITPTFAQVGTLDKLVNTTDLSGTGAESYKQPFAKPYGEGGITEEGAAATDVDIPFGYADITKVKITAYAEVTAEVEKLPSADYVAKVDEAVVGAWYKKLNGQIVNGTGKKELVGIVNAPETIIDAKQTKVIATIDEHTLDEFIFDYGGDENVESDAYIILNKLTLKAFAKVKGTDKRRAYDIVVHGNTGTINGIPFVCSSKVAAYDKVTAGNPYMIYGKLAGYELAFFTALDVEKSTDYKFKDDVIAFKVTGYAGGSPAMWNGFLKVVKEAASE